MYYIINSIPGRAITIVHGDREAIATEDRDDVRRRTTTSKVRRLLRREITSRYRTLDVRCAKHLLWQSAGGVLTRDGHASFPIEPGVIVMVDFV